MGEKVAGRIDTWIKVLVGATSLCPCSKAISSTALANQRSHITMNVKVDGGMWLEDLIEIAEQEASCELWGVLKREDEKYVTERAYENPKFVEDLVSTRRRSTHRRSPGPRVLCRVGKLRVDPQPLGVRPYRRRQGRLGHWWLGGNRTHDRAIMSRT